MSLTDPFPDLEKALIRGIPVALADIYGRVGVKGADSVPAAEALTPMLSVGFFRVNLLDDTRTRLDRVGVVDIDTFAATRSLAYDVAQEIAGVLASVRSLDGVLLDGVTTESGPKRVPWDNQSTRRFLATYRISTRR